MNTDKIIDFIRRRFHDDNHWTDGNCYWAAWILCEQFPCLSMYYRPNVGHFVAGDGNVFFDGHGQYEGQFVLVSLKEMTLDDMKNKNIVLSLDDIEATDYSWYQRIMRDCRN